MKTPHLNYYKILCAATSALFFYLFLTLLFQSDEFVRDMGLSASGSTSILARRASILMLGFSLTLFFSRSLPQSGTRKKICLAAAITMLGLACMGTYEFLKGSVNTSIIQAIIIESVSGFSFLTIYLMKEKKVSQI